MPRCMHELPNLKQAGGTLVHELLNTDAIGQYAARRLCFEGPLTAPYL